MLSTAQGHLRTDHTLKLLHQCKTQLASKKLRLKTKNKEKWCRMEVGSWCVQQHFSDHHLPAVVFMFQFFIFLPFFLSFHFFTVAEVIAGVVRVWPAHRPLALCHRCKQCQGQPVCFLNTVLTLQSWGVSQSSQSTPSLFTFLCFHTIFTVHSLTIHIFMFSHNLHHLLPLRHISKLFLHIIYIYNQPSVKSVYKTNHFANIKHIHKHQTQIFKELVPLILPLLKEHTCSPHGTFNTRLKYGRIQSIFFFFELHLLKPY